MSAVAVAIGGAAVAGVGGAFISSSATRDAAQTQAEATRYAADLQNQQFLQQQENQRPWIQAGQAVLPQLQSMASQPVNFTSQDFQNNQDPAYQFDLQQGQQALERSAAARGGLMSGGTLKDLTSYSQGMASNEYQNAYGRFMNNQNTQFNRLASVAGMGQTGTGMLAQAGMNTANNMSNIATSGANAQAGAQIAQGNIWGNTLSGLGSSAGNTLMGYQNMNMMNNWMNRMYPQQTPGLAPSPPPAMPSPSASTAMLEVG